MWFNTRKVYCVNKNIFVCTPHVMSHYEISAKMKPSVILSHVMSHYEISSQDETICHTITQNSLYILEFIKCEWKLVISNDDAILNWLHHVCIWNTIRQLYGCCAKKMHLTFILVQVFLVWHASPTSGLRRYVICARCLRLMPDSWWTFDVYFIDICNI